MADEWKRIGHLPVDAGCLLIVDPCYLRDALFKTSKEVEKWYDDAVVDKAGADYWPISEPGGSANALGHVVATGSDGFYPIEVRYAKGGGIAEIRIRFEDDAGA